MNMQVYCNDLYDLNSENTQMYDEHKKWYNDFKATSVGDLLDKQQDIIDRYERAVDNSTIEIAELEEENCDYENMLVERDKIITDLEEQISVLAGKLKL